MIEPPPTPKSPARKPETAPAPARAPVSTRRSQVRFALRSWSGRLDVKAGRLDPGDELAPQKLGVLRGDRLEADLAEWTKLREPAEVGADDRCDLWVAARRLCSPRQHDRSTAPRNLDAAGENGVGHDVEPALVLQRRPFEPVSHPVRLPGDLVMARQEHCE